jgi:hypothetical protein
MHTEGVEKMTPEVDLKKVEKRETAVCVDGFFIYLRISDLLDYESARDLVRALKYLSNDDVKISLSQNIMLIEDGNTPNVTVKAEWICDYGHSEEQIAIIIPTEDEHYIFLYHILTCDRGYHDFVGVFRDISDVQFSLALCEFSEETINEALRMLRDLQEQLIKSN